MTLVDLRAEAAVVGAALLSTEAARLIIERGVRPEHLTSEYHRIVFAAVDDLTNEGAGVDTTGVCSRLQQTGRLDSIGGHFTVDAMCAEAAAVGNLPAHCDTVVKLAEWRRTQDGALGMVAAAQAMDQQAFEMAEATLWQNADQRGRRSDWTPEQAGEDFMKSLDAEPQDVFPWPFDKLNMKSDGGAARGEITVLAGPVTHGKSAFLDMCLESMHKPGLTVRLYLNEMKRRQRLARVCARRSGVELTHIQQAMRNLRHLPEHDKELVRRSWANYPVNITEASGWPIERICRHARRSGADVIAVDILNRLPFGNSDRSRTQQLEDAANQLDRLAKDCDMHVIVVTHLNRSRAAVQGRAPIPSLTDIKECAALAEIADNVVFVWREPDENGDPQDNGAVRFGKNRTGELGGLEVRFDGPHQRFLAIDRHLEAVAG
jgi:replicative DNA helicase